MALIAVLGGRCKNASDSQSYRPVFTAVTRGLPVERAFANADVDGWCAVGGL